MDPEMMVVIDTPTSTRIVADHRTLSYEELQMVGRCNAPVRGGGICKLKPGHAKHHSTVVFECDGCDGTFRGTPFAYGRDGEYPQGLQFCFLCARGLR